MHPHLSRRSCHAHLRGRNSAGSTCTKAGVEGGGRRRGGGMGGMRPLETLVCELRIRLTATHTTAGGLTPRWSSKTLEVELREDNKATRFPLRSLSLVLLDPDSGLHRPFLTLCHTSCLKLCHGPFLGCVMGPVSGCVIGPFLGCHRPCLRLP